MTKLQNTTAGLILLMSSLYATQAHAVLCTVATSDARYHVSSYVRNQTSCKSTLLAEGATGWAAVGQMVVMVLAVKAFHDVIMAQADEERREYLINQMKQDKDAKVYSCTRKGTIQIITANGNAYADYDNLVLNGSYPTNTYRVYTARGEMIFNATDNTLSVKDHKESSYRVGSCDFVGMLSR